MNITGKDQESNVVQRARGMASGVLFLVFFGMLWAAIGINGLKGLGEPWLLVVVMLVGLGLLIAGVSLSRASRRLPVSVEKKETQDRQSRNKWFVIVFGTELITILIANVICRAVNRFDLFFPVMMLIVGVHFFPLASLLRVKRYQIAGVLLCLLALVTLFVVPEQFYLGNFEITARWVILGFGGAFILWFIGFANWLQGRELFAQSKS